MRPKLFTIMICSFLMLMACKNESNIRFSEKNYTSDNNNIVEVNIPIAFGNQNIVNAINDEIKRFVIAALQIGDPDPNAIEFESIEESITSFNKEFEIFKNDYPDAPQSWEVQIDGEVLFQSYEIISIAITVYQNTGGAHGNTSITFLNFEAESGNRIPNSKLISNLEKFEEIAKTYFDKAINNKDVLFDAEIFQLPENIAYNNEGLVLLYNTYEVAPYSTGIIDFTIPFEEIDSYLTFNSL